MTSVQFCFWLQGMFEISAAGSDEGHLRPQMALNADQVQCIRRHLALVFKHEIDPQAGDKGVQDVLNQIHDMKKPNHGIAPANFSENDIRYRC